MAGVRATIGRRFREAVHAIFLQTSDREEWRPRVALGVSVTNTAGELQLFLGYMAVSYPLEWYSQPRSGDTGRGRRERRRDSNRWAERCWCRGRV